MKFDKIRVQTETEIITIKLNQFHMFQYKTFEVGINPSEGLFSTDISCKFIAFTKQNKKTQFLPPELFDS